MDLTFIMDTQGGGGDLHPQLFSWMLTQASGLNRVGSGASDKLQARLGSLVNCGLVDHYQSWFCEDLLVPKGKLLLLEGQFSYQYVIFTCV